METCSSIGCWLQCRKKHHYKYGLRLTIPKFNKNLVLGTLTHAAMEEMNDISIRGLTSEFYEKFPEHHEAINAEWIKAQAMVLGNTNYFDRLLESDDRWNGHITDMHREVEWLWRDKTYKFIHAGKSDGVCKYKGERAVYELKTAADGDRTQYIENLKLDRQINSNMIAQGAEVMIYDIIWKPRIRQKMKETPMEFAHRFGEVYATEPGDWLTRLFIKRSPAQLERYRHELALYMAEIKIGKVYRNPGACNDYNTLCEYHDMCVDDLDSDGYEVRELRHPELTRELQEIKWEK